MHALLSKTLFLGSIVHALASCLGMANAQDYEPEIPIRSASDEGAKAMARFSIPEGMRVELFAAEPALANPVSFTIDAHGRVYVCETFRLHKGVTDNRNHGGTWLDEELACRTVADRVAMYERKFPGTIDEWKREHERVRRIVDRDGDGHADEDVVFADGFKQLADGIAAGVLTRGSHVYYTCIPTVWDLEDADGDGRAEKRTALQTGYGVHTSLLGHDMHGLILGPDGKLWFSIGDRGFDVTNDGVRFAYPDEGAVLRCNLDGSGLEVVHRGLRNPQELAFDDYGNCFTGDNNSDGGDRARWVYVVEGGNSGWHIGFQSISDRGPWNREKMWWPMHDGQPAYIVPPIANVTNGPSGLVCDPGTGLPDKYRGCFLLCDFRGASAYSGITALRNRPRGAGFELASTAPFVWKVLATDVDIGPDGAVWISDWTEGWGQTGKGRLYRVVSENNAFGAGASAVRETQRLLREGMSDRSTGGVAALLRHADRRIRLEAQLELVQRGASDVLQSATTSTEPELARLHAIWGLGILARTDPRVLDGLKPLLEDFDEEVRAQTAKVLGEAAQAAMSERMQAALPALRRCLEDRSARVQFFAAIALGKLADTASRDALLRVLEQNEGRDPYLRHAAVFGLAHVTRALGKDGIASLLRETESRSQARRHGAVLALRRLEDPNIRAFLTDPDPIVLAEAARAIHDTPIPGAHEALSALGDDSTIFERVDGETSIRVLAAGWRSGTVAALTRLLSAVRSADLDIEIRRFALQLLADFDEPRARDPIVNLHRPLAPRTGLRLDTRLEDTLGPLVGPAPELVPEIAAIARKRRLVGLAGPLASIVRDAASAPPARRAAFETLMSFGDGAPDLEGLAEICSNSKDPLLRGSGLRFLVKNAPTRALPVCIGIVRGNAPIVERQNALRLLGTIANERVDTEVATLLAMHGRQKLEPALLLEVLEAAADRPALRDKLSAFESARADGGVVALHTECLEGGDPKKGEAIFRRHAAAQCTRCHTVDGKGGNAGPDLLGIASRRKPAELLESLLDPGAKIVEGFGTYVFEMKDGNVHSGSVRELDGGKLEVRPETGEPVVIDPADVEFKSEPTSAMPGVRGILDKRQIRDLLAWLRSKR
ncbi:MAG: HEAT repeat domain-containing protein [Planctomycetes bacterium]|nr:HEAT repeat domain-containing protein [Planctomycetota bacterium]